MMYGHEFDRGWSTSGLMLCAAVSAIVGVAVGVLMAPATAAAGRRALETAESARVRTGPAGREPLAAAHPFTPGIDSPRAMLE